MSIAMCLTRLLIVPIACFAVTAAHADGSVVFEQADRYLKEAPELRSFLMDTLCISENGAAIRLAGDYPLGGARIGPYEFQARAKGDPAGARFTLRIVTTQQLFGKDGKPLLSRYGEAPRVYLAYRIDEHFRAIELRPPRHWAEGMKSVNCDGAL